MGSDDSIGIVRVINDSNRNNNLTKSLPLVESEYNKFINVFIEIIMDGVVEIGDFCEKTSFKSCRVPSISLGAYISRIIRSKLMSTQSLIVAIMYLKRFIDNTEVGFFNYLTVHRIVLIAILIASKYVDDELYTNKDYARLGGIDLENMNSMELEFLFRVGFSLYIEQGEYNQLCDEIRNLL